MLKSMLPLTFKQSQGQVTQQVAPLCCRHSGAFSGGRPITAAGRCVPIWQRRLLRWRCAHSAVTFRSRCLAPLKHAPGDEPLAWWQNLQGHFITLYSPVLHHMALHAQPIQIKGKPAWSTRS